MITTAITVNSDGATILSAGATYGILVAILVSHGVVCSAATRILARLNLLYVIVTGAPNLPFSRKKIVQFVVAQLERPSQLLLSCLSAQGIGGSQRMMLSLCLRITLDGPIVSLVTYTFFHNLTMRRSLGIPLILHLGNVDVNGV